jgi:hypothetical protein
MAALPATLAAPVITRQPQSVTVFAGAEARFAVTVRSPSGTKYQWRFDGAALAGATSAELVLASAQLSHAGRYSVQVSDKSGSTVSSEASLTVLAGPAIAVQPQSQTVSPGATVELRVTARGNPAPTYQWSLNGDFIPGATSDALVLANVGPSDGGSYAVTLLNDLGSVLSEPALVQVTAPLLPFADHFAARGSIASAAGSGQGATFGATRESNEPLHAGKKGNASVWLSWRAPATGIATFSTDGSSFDTLLAVYVLTPLGNLQAVASDDDSAGYHTSVVRFNALAGAAYELAVDGFDQAQGEVTLNWELVATPEQLPVIASWTPDTTLQRGDTLNLSVDVLSRSPVSLQWLCNGQALPGATGGTLSLPNFQDANVGRYAVQLSTATLSYPSSPIEVQINTEGWTNVAARNKPADALQAKLTLAMATSPVDVLLKSRRALASTKLTRWKSLEVVRGYTGTQIFATAPGKDPDEPNHCGVVGGASYWFAYEPPESGWLALNTDGSNFDTVLAVYTDDGLGHGYDNLHSVACDNNSGLDGRDSALRFQAAAGMTYYVVVDGVAGATGTVYLNYNLNALPNLSTLAAQTVAEDASTGALSFTVSDRETVAGSLLVSGRSSNTALVPAGNITFGGSGASRTVTVRPALNRSGTATISIAVTDAGGATATRSFTLTVTPVNDPPAAADDSASLPASRTVWLDISGLLSNDRDVDGDALSLASFSATSYRGGSITRSGNSLVFRASPYFQSPDFFSYTISDGRGGSASGLVRIY